MTVYRIVIGYSEEELRLPLLSRSRGALMNACPEIDAAFQRFRYVISRLARRERVYRAESNFVVAIRLQKNMRCVK